MRYDGHFRLAQQLGKSLNEVMGLDGPMTHRQFLAWQYWMNLQQNVPDKTDHYLMQIACEVRRVLAKHPRQIKIEDFKLTFSNQANKHPKALTKEGKIEASKSMWLGMMNSDINIIDKDGNVIGKIEQKKKDNKIGEPIDAKRNGDRGVSSQHVGKGRQVPRHAKNSKRTNRKADN